MLQVNRHAEPKFCVYINRQIKDGDVLIEVEEGEADLRLLHILVACMPLDGLSKYYNHDKIYETFTLQFCIFTIWPMCYQRLFIPVQGFSTLFFMQLGGVSYVLMNKCNLLLVSLHGRLSFSKVTTTVYFIPHSHEIQHGHTFHLVMGAIFLPFNVNGTSW